MIDFIDLSISRDGRHLIIEAQVNNLSYYDNIKIKSVQIDTEKTFKQMSPNNSYIYYKQYKKDQQQKKIRLELSSLDLKNTTLTNTLFFVTIDTSGIPSTNTPCGMDNKTTLGITFDVFPYFQKMMYYIKQVGQNCTIPTGFIDAFLQFKALQVAIETQNHTEAIKLWDMFKDSIKISLIKPCNCNG